MVGGAGRSEDLAIVTEKGTVVSMSKLRSNDAAHASINDRSGEKDRFMHHASIDDWSSEKDSTFRDGLTSIETCLIFSRAVRWQGTFRVKRKKLPN